MSTLGTTAIVLAVNLLAVFSNTQTTETVHYVLTNDSQRDGLSLESIAANHSHSESSSVLIDIHV